METIAAIATAPGRGGIGIIRVSGSEVPSICQHILGRKPKPRHASLHRFYAADGVIIDEGVALFFPEPNSFTGQDCLELQGHGGPVVLDSLLERVLELGARMARPGEFTERAFLNNKIDLAQAEAVADLIDSSSRQAARAAMNSLRGVFSQRINELVDSLVELRIYVESAIDFPEEELDFLADETISEQLRTLQSQLLLLLDEAGQGQLLRDGMTVVIAGRPNAGKSSLLNQLSGRDAAIITPLAGTTRDILREQIHIDGMPLHVIDTAGLRHSDNPIEQEGIKRAWNEIQAADHLLFMLDDCLGITAEDRHLYEQLPADIPLTVVSNKIDLSGNAPQAGSCDWGAQIRLSAKTGQGLELLRQALKQQMGYRSADSGQFSARRRHLQVLQQAQNHLHEAVYQLEQVRAGELVAEELRLVQQLLGEITGEFTSDDLLGRIFTSFCIGK